MAQAAAPTEEDPARSQTSRTRALVVLFVGLFVVLFAWAKWTPYWFKVPEVAASGDLGESVIGDGGSPTPVSLAAGWDFLAGYVLDVWPAIVAGLVVAAAAQNLLPRRLLTRAFAGTTDRGGLASTGRAVLAGMPMMLCTCCSAPVAVAMRRCRVPVRPALAYWLSTPLLNPVVLIFAAVVLSPAWMGLRLGCGALVAFLATWLATRTGTRGDAVLEADPSDVPGDRAAAGLGSFVKALVGLSVRLLPEYLLLVFALGAVRGVLFPLGEDLASWGVLAVMLLAVAGMMLAVPTGGEIAVVAALLAVGFPAWLVAALLVTLPAVSLPSLSMVARSFPRQVSITVPLVVVGGGLLTSGAAWALAL